MESTQMSPGRIAIALLVAVVLIGIALEFFGEDTTDPAFVPRPRTCEELHDALRIAELFDEHERAYELKRDIKRLCP